MSTATKAMRRFYLVQRIKRSRLVDLPDAKKKGLLAKLGSNPFGYGNLGHYDLEYMGSAEFEWGAIPEAFDRLKKAGKDIDSATFDYNGTALDFLWIKKEGNPFEDWVAWLEGKPRIDDYGYSNERRPCEGKEPPYELRQRLVEGKDAPEWGWTTDVWWALGENVMWAFADEGHLARMVESMQGVPNRLRG